MFCPKSCPTRWTEHVSQLKGSFYVTVLEGIEIWWIAWPVFGISIMLCWKKFYFLDLVRWRYKLKVPMYTLNYGSIWQHNILIQENPSYICYHYLAQSKILYQHLPSSGLVLSAPAAEQSFHRSTPQNNWYLRIAHFLQVICTHNALE